MNTPILDPGSLIARLTQPGAPFELCEVALADGPARAYRHAPPSLIALIEAGRVHGAKEFMAHAGERWSYERFFAAVDALAGRLQAEVHLEPGDRVAIAMRNRPEWAVAFAATVLVGAVPAPLNSFGLRDELRGAIAEVSPRVLVCDDERLDRLAPDLATLGCHVVNVGRVPDPASGVLAWAPLVAPGGPARQPVTRQPEDAALLVFTSGSTSRPKAVLSSHRAVAQALMNIDFIGALSGMSSPQAVAAIMAKGLAPATLTVVPLFHVSGLYAQLLTTLRGGRRLVFMHRWDPAQALQIIRDEKITQFSAAPAMVQQLMQVAGFDPAASAASLGGVGFGGSGLPQGLIDQVLARFPHSMSGIGFGMTESNGVGAAISGQLFEGRPRSSGLSSPVIELRIVDADGQPLPAGEAGEICLRGVTLMQGYWGQPEATAQALHGGWLHTGDIGYVDAAGFLFVVDRLKDVINRSGEKIAAAEVESCLSRHPGVDEVAVFAVPDAQTGEAVVAVVVLRPGRSASQADLQAHVAAHLAGYKVPSRIELRAEPLPRNATGKLVKAELRRLYAQP
jgi:long-chain acyl-CoA synthetase